MRKLKAENNNPHAKTIVLGITGSIAAYKAGDIASKLTAAGHNVCCILTAGGAEFITALTLQSITGNPVYGHMVDVGAIAQWDIKHLSLADAADIIVESKFPLSRLCHNSLFFLSLEGRGAR